jgi:hypothetical protein
MEISGKEFKEKYPNTAFYKLTNEYEYENGFYFKDGLNIYTPAFNPFNLFGYSSDYGLYFTEVNKIGTGLNIVFYYDCEDPWECPAYHTEMKYIREIEILDDSLICTKHGDFFKANKFVLKKRILLKDFSLWNVEKFCKLMVEQNSRALEFAKRQTKEICEFAVQQNYKLLEFIKEPTKEICELARALEYAEKEKSKDIDKIIGQHMEDNKISIYIAMSCVVALFVLNNFYFIR